MSTRDYWCDIAVKLCLPVLDAFSQQKFKKLFIDKQPTAPLEALSRVLCGIAPWIELNVDQQAMYLGQLARKAIEHLTNPISNDYVDFSVSDQVLVDSAILCQALLCGYKQLWCQLSNEVKQNIIKYMKNTRRYQAHDNNWVLFPSMIEAFLLEIGESVDDKRLMDGLFQYKKWYVGDGVYGDGEEYHCDYYNSFIIHPMLYYILQIVNKHKGELVETSKRHKERMKRWSTLQERMIAPNGTFPCIGRSMCYRSGAFHGLSLCVLENNLPSSLKPGQVRVALTRVIKATLECPKTFENGWLTKGLYGHQPSLAEPYINHGSLYICSTIFLPLGLCNSAMFWTDEDCPTTWELIERGEDLYRDKPYTECNRKIGQCV